MYILFALVLFQFFIEITTTSVQSLVDRENLLRKVRFPRLAVPFSVALTALFNLGMTLVAVFVFALASGVTPRWTWLELPLLVLVLLVFALGIGMLLSVLYVRYRDVKPIWEVVSQALFYASPVLYVATMVPADVQGAYQPNPIAAVLTEMRAAIIDPTAAHVWDSIGDAELLLIPGGDRGGHVRAGLVGVQPRGAPDRRAPLAMARLKERLRALAPASRAPAAEPPAEDWTARNVAAEEGLAQPWPQRLLDRLRPEDVEAVEASLDAEAAGLWAQAAPAHRGYLTLAYGVHFRVPGVLERTGLTTDAPPPEVHAMGRGPLAAGGDYYTADLVAEALLRAGADIGAVRRGLDFGCSSGRVLRPLVVAYPDVEWHGVDPNAEAVAWAAEHVPGAAFAPSASDPPLDFPDAHFDLVYAISIWSHFGERSARLWLDEMRRLVAPGGHLVLTVHSAQSIAHNRAHRVAVAGAAHRDRGGAPPARLLVRARVRRAPATTGSCIPSGAPRS